MGILSSFGDSAEAQVYLTTWISKLERYGEASVKLEMRRLIRSWKDEQRRAFEARLQSIASHQNADRLRPAAEVCELFAKVIREP